MHLIDPDISRRVYFLAGVVHTFFETSEAPNRPDQFSSTFRSILTQQINRLHHELLWITDTRISGYGEFDPTSRLLHSRYYLSLVFSPGFICDQPHESAKDTLDEMIRLEPVNTETRKKLRFVRQRTDVYPMDDVKGCHPVRPEFIFNVLAWIEAYQRCS